MPVALSYAIQLALVFISTTLLQQFLRLISFRSENVIYPLIYEELLHPYLAICYAYV